MIGLSTRGSISFGWAFVAGRNRVPRPAAGKTAFLTTDGIPQSYFVAPLCAMFRPSKNAFGINRRGRGGRRGTRFRLCVLRALGGERSVSAISQTCSQDPATSTGRARPGPANLIQCSRMLDPNYVREHIDAVRTGLKNRGVDPDKALEEIATLDIVRRRSIKELEGLKREQNTAGDAIAQARRQGKDTASIQEAGRARNAHIKQLDVQLTSIEHQWTSALMTLPNLPHESVPVGKSAQDNQEVRRHGEPRQ